MELKNKVISFLGDSITEGAGVENIAENRYDNILLKKENLKAVYNYGIGGTRIAHQQIPSDEARYDLCFCGRAYDINPESDIIIVFGGTNDYDHGDAPFGEETDKTSATFCGAVDFLMNLLKEKYPNSKLVFLTPARRVGDENKSSNPCKKADLKPLKGYVDLIISKGKQYNIPVLNLYDELKINPNIDEENKKYTADGLHLNDNGHMLLAQKVIEFLHSI